MVVMTQPVTVADIQRASALAIQAFDQVRQLLDSAEWWFAGVAEQLRSDARRVEAMLQLAHTRALALRDTLREVVPLERRLLDIHQEAAENAIVALLFGAHGFYEAGGWDCAREGWNLTSAHATTISYASTVWEDLLGGPWQTGWARNAIDPSKLPSPDAQMAFDPRTQMDELGPWYALDLDLDDDFPSNWQIARSWARNAAVYPWPSNVTEFKQAIRNEERAALKLLAEKGRGQPGGKGKARPKATAAARMIDLIKDPATHTWTAEQFRVKLGYRSRSTITNTPAWKQLAVARESARLQQAERAHKRGLDMKVDKRRRPKRKRRPFSLGD
jgi:hypothetical protein